MGAPLANSTLRADNDSSCVTDPYDSVEPNLLVVIRFIQIPTFAVIFLLSVALNGFVLCLSIGYKLYKEELYHPLQIIVGNLVYSVVVFLNLFTSAVYDGWIFGDAVCQYTTFVMFWLVNVRFCLMLVLSLDRFLTVIRPFSYPRVSKKVTTALSITMWLLLVPLSYMPFIDDFGCYQYAPLLKSCGYAQGCDPRRCFGYNMVLCTLIIVFAGGVPVSLYGFLYRKARQVRNQIHPVIEGHQSAVGLRNTASKKATVTFFLLFVTLVGCVVPFYFSHILSYFVLKTAGVRPPAPMAVFHCLGHALFISMPIADAVTIMRNGDVRAVMHKMYKSLRDHASSSIGA